MAQRTFDINSEEQYNQVCKTVSQKKKSSKIMRLLINALEAYRQARKLGWSRPWNKYDLNTFQSFKLNTGRDASLIELLDTVFENDIPMPKSARLFVKDLVADSRMMGFVFVHEFKEAGTVFEGATVSIGRIVDKKFRDRVDLIFESEIRDNTSQGLTRVRVFIDPFTETREPLWSTTVTPDFSKDIMALFSQMVDISWNWHGQADKEWKHWTIDYIDYFGDRKTRPDDAYFYCPGCTRTKERTSKRDDKERAA